MERYYQPIDGKNLNFDKDVIKEIFGAAGDVIVATDITLGKVIEKYAFYNTGNLCEVQIEHDSPVMCIRCYGLRSKDVLHWLKQYLAIGMHACGWETDICEDKDDYFYARFYQKGTE
jgi:hypothetical protein